MLLNSLLLMSQIEMKPIDAEQLEEFLDRCGSVEGVRYPTSYIKEQGEAWGVFRHGELLGGYVIIVKVPFRTTSFLAAHGIPHDYSDDELIELGGVWMEKAFRQKRYTTPLWLHMTSRIKANNKNFVIYGYSLQKKGLQKLYAAGNPHILFRGFTATGEGLKTHSTASIEVINTSRATAAIFFKALGRVFTLKLVKSGNNDQLPELGSKLENIESHRTVLSE